MRNNDVRRDNTDMATVTKRRSAQPGLTHVLNRKFITDKEGNKTAVILDFREYQNLLMLLQPKTRSLRGLDSLKGDIKKQRKALRKIIGIGSNDDPTISRNVDAHLYG